MESWRNRKTLILSRADMVGLVTPEEYNGCVEQAFRMFGEGRVHMEPKGHIVLDQYPGEWEIMPSYIEEPESAACKWVSIRFENRARHDLPTVFSILVYTHPATGFPLAICDGSHHTNMRTGASAAVSATWLARKDASVLAIVGAGDSARGAMKCCRAIFPWDEVRVWSRSRQRLDEFVEEVGPFVEGQGYEIRPSLDLQQTVRGADVVVTVTPSQRWIVDGCLDRAGDAHRGYRRRACRKPGARPPSPEAGPNLHRRYPPVPGRRRDQRPRSRRAAVARRCRR